MNQLIQIIGSLAAILALAWIAARLKLGGDRRIVDEAEAGRLADEAVSGFTASDIAIDRDRTAALMRDAQGRVLLLRRHGAHFAGRVLDPGAEIALSGNRVELVPADRRFGPATLNFDNRPPEWVVRLTTGGN
ncbi:hypothetical protein GRI58_03150 [Porphyrobacter algicida]|uniref:Uncharacterized protein n=1 Tax=Qipengyuania algicida TaxID=1836209 RepID=A0A845AC50_9SPHN|nr:hypothetical protein [Qipengyuania algicida]MXP27820.1 hypothetical protein [Qipengyuania algicida]